MPYSGLVVACYRVSLSEVLQRERRVFFSWFVMHQRQPRLGLNRQGRHAYHAPLNARRQIGAPFDGSSFDGCRTHFLMARLFDGTPFDGTPFDKIGHAF